MGFISSLLGSKAEQENSAKAVETCSDKVDISRNSNELKTNSGCLSEASVGHTVVTKYQEVVFLRTVVELALVNLAVGDKWQPGNNLEKESIHLGKIMAPPG